MLVNPMGALTVDLDAPPDTPSDGSALSLISPIGALSDGTPGTAAAAAAKPAVRWILMSLEQRARRLDEHYDMLQVTCVPRPASWLRS